MKRPPKRTKLPARNSNNDKRCLLANPDPSCVSQLKQKIWYQGSSKHKRTPHICRLPPFRGKSGDETLCDRNANFRNIKAMPQLIQRGPDAGLVGTNGIIWTLADDGWIFEGRVTNRTTMEYHGYPVRPSEAIAEQVYRRFSEWASQCGDNSARQAAANCRTRYGLK